MKKRILTIMGLLGVCFLSACTTPQPAADPVPTQAVESTRKENTESGGSIQEELTATPATDVEPTEEAEPTMEPTVTSTQTPEPTVTSEPTKVPKPTATPKPTCNHKYSEATCNRPATCETCGDKKGSALGHDYEGKMFCSRCHKKNDNFKEFLEWRMEGTTLIISGQGYMSSVIDVWEPMHFPVVSV